MKKDQTKYDLVGSRFNKLNVLEYLGTSSTGHPRYRCICDCGKETVTRAINLVKGYTKSCGCIDTERKKRLALRLKISNTKDPSKVAERNIFDDYKKGAVKRKVEFRLTLDEFYPLLHLPCHYCHSEPKNVHIVVRRGANVCIVYNGIDRIDSSKGYSIDNVVPCCKNCNFAKNDLSLDQFKKLIHNIYHNFVIFDK